MEANKRALIELRKKTNFQGFNNAFKGPGDPTAIPNNNLSLTDGYILIGNASNLAEEHQISGDATLSNSGVLTLNTVGISKGGTGKTSWTTGSIIFAGSTTLDEDNSYLYYDKTNHAVGLGTNSLYSNTMISGKAKDTTSTNYYLKYRNNGNTQDYFTISNRGAVTVYADTGTDTNKIFNASSSAISNAFQIQEDGRLFLKANKERAFRIDHTNGNYFEVLVGDGSAILATGQAGFSFNGTTRIIFSTLFNSFPYPDIRVANNAHTFSLRGGFSANTVGNSILLGANNVSGGPWTATSGIQNTVTVGAIDGVGNSQWAPASGNAEYNVIRLNPRYNTTGSYSGIARSMYIVPSFVSNTGLDLRCIEVESIYGEHLRLSYNSSNYFKATVDSGGNITFDLSAGSGTPEFTFGKSLTATSLKTDAPSGGTAKKVKLGEIINVANAGLTALGIDKQQRIDVDGTVYYAMLSTTQQ